MGIFRKNKRQFGIRSHRRVFVALFLVSLFGISAILSFILSANAQLVPIASVEILSEHSSYPDGHPGAWRVTKSAEWKDVGKARITFDVESIAKYDTTKKYDILMVIDNSGSMGGDKIDQVKSDAIDLVDTILDDPDNKVALVTFNSTASVLSGFTNEEQTILSLIDGIMTPGSTNYYEGLLKAEDVLDGYTQQDNHELVLLFLTDGFPNEETPNEIAQYRTLKTKYPYMTINGIQYEMGDTVLQPIIDVSDNQFIADMSSLNNVLFEATITPYIYDDFIITDYINDTYWTVADINALAASLGEIALEYDGNTPKVVWDMSNTYHSGGTATLTIEIDLKSEVISQAGLLLPTNTHEEILTTISESPDEYIDSTDTPILKALYNVIYNANAPSGCDVSGVVPETTSYTIFSSVAILDNVLSCPGYTFKGWRIATQDVKRINDDYFRMPGHDVYLVATWGKLSISKSLDGTSHRRASAEFDKGPDVNRKMRTLSGQTTNNTVITAIKKASSLSPTVNPNDSNYILSSSQSEIPIYGWFDDGIFYFYTDAEDIYLNQNASSMFNALKGLSDISDLAYMDSSRATSLSSLFGYTAITNIDALRNWDVSKVISMDSTFANTQYLENIDGAINWDTSSLKQVGTMFSHAQSLKNIDGALNWDMSNVESMSWMFLDAKSLENIDGAINWDTSKVKSFYYMFGDTNNLDNIDGAIKWDTSSVTDMHMMFEGSGVTDIDGAINWDTSNVTNVTEMFRYAHRLQNVDGAINWDTSKMTSFYFLFGGDDALESVAGLSSWDTSNVTNMTYTFLNNTHLLTLDGLSSWDVSNVTDMTSMFSSCSKVPTLEPLSNWNVSKVTNMNSIFGGNSSLPDLSGLETWDVSNVTNLETAFSFTRVKNVNALSEWNTSKVEDMSGLFNFVEPLEDISGLSNWDTSSVTDMANLFYYNVKLKNIDALSGWDVSNVTNMSSMFYYVSFPNSSATALSNWNVSKVTNMGSMFQCSKSITNLNMLQNWNVSSATNMSSMFQCTYGLTDITGISGWNVSNVTNMSGMFYTSSFTSTSALSGWDVSNVTNMSKMFYDDDVNDLTGLGNWRPTSVTNVSSMFYNDRYIRDLSPLNNWVMPDLTNMANTFYNIPTTVERPTWYTE